MVGARLRRPGLVGGGDQLPNVTEEEEPDDEDGYAGEPPLLGAVGPGRVGGGRGWGGGRGGGAAGGALEQKKNIFFAQNLEPQVLTRCVRYAQ